MKQGEDYVLPTVEGGGLESLQSSATALLNNVNAPPFRQIGDDLKAILGNANQLMSSPQPKQLIGLSFLLIMMQMGRAEWLRDRTRLYYIVRFVGRWSMIDIFMQSLLGALVWSARW